MKSFGPIGKVAGGLSLPETETCHDWCSIRHYSVCELKYKYNYKYILQTLSISRYCSKGLHCKTTRKWWLSGPPHARTSEKKKKKPGWTEGCPRIWRYSTFWTESSGLVVRLWVWQANMVHIRCIGKHAEPVSLHLLIKTHSACPLIEHAFNGHKILWKLEQPDEPRGTEPEHGVSHSDILVLVLPSQWSGVRLGSRPWSCRYCICTELMHAVSDQIILATCML